MGYMDERGEASSRREGLRAQLDEAERELEAMRRRIGQIRAELGDIPSTSASRPERSGAAALVISIGAILALLGAGAALYLNRRATSVPPPNRAPRPQTTITRAPASVSAPSNIFVSEGACFLNASEDGIADIAAMARFSGDPKFHVAVFDGHTGRRRWQSARSFTEGGSSSCNVACPVKDAVFAWCSDRNVRLFDSHTGAERWSVPVSDAPLAVGFGPGCASVELIDETFARLDLATGAERACSPSSGHTNLERERTARAGKSPSVRAAGRTVTLTAKTTGTPILIVSSDGPNAWERRLDLKALGGFRELDIQATQDVVVVLGSDPVEGDSLTLVGIEASNGQVIYSKSVGKTNNAWVPLFRIQGPYLHATIGALRAFDPATGEEVWQVGL
jgi:outer membrane protein assembly factor BamB